MEKKYKLEKYFEIAEQHSILKNIVADLRKLYVDCGNPFEPTGPITSARCPSLSEPYDFGEGSEFSISIDLSNQYNKIMIALIECSGYYHLSGNHWFTMHDSGSESWEKYKEQSSKIVEEFITCELYESFMSLI